MATTIQLEPKRIPELLHHAFDPGTTRAQWLQAMCEGFRRVLAGADATIGLTEYDGEESIAPRQHNTFAGERLQRMVESMYPPEQNLAVPVHVFLRYYFPRALAITQSEVERGAPPFPALLEARRRFGIHDITGMVLHPAPGLAATVSAAIPRKTALDRRARTLLTRLGLHLETAMRLRLQPEAVHAVLSPSGKLLHSEGGALHPRLVERVENTRSDAEERLAVWTALIGGRFGLVEREERGVGRHYLLLENPPRARERRKLSNIEATVVHDLARGMRGKTIAYSLGISPAAVSTAVASAAPKLGFRSTLALVAAVRALVTDPQPIDFSRLTEAERGVLELLVAGGSNLEIAQARGTSQRTVANQVASILKKTGADSRRALRIAR